MNGSTVSIDHVSKHFGDFHALDDINFTIKQGEFFSLLGPSGCGKTTLLRIIAGFEFPDEGTVLFDDQNIISLPANKRQSNTVFQSYALFPHLSVYENVAFPLRLKKIAKSEIDEKVKKYLHLVQLEQHMYKKPNQLSGGQRQRVAIARALINEPKVLLLDEPLSNLDARLRLQTREEIRRIQKETGITTIFVTHDQEEAMSISDLIVVMKDGMIQQIDAPQEVYDDPANLFVAKFLGTPAIHVFHGEAKGGELYLAGENTPVLSVPGVADQKLWVGVRPEGLIPDPAGPLCCSLRSVEVMGRDTSVVFDHPAADSENPRAIVASARRPKAGETQVRFSLDREKVHLFRKDTEERIHFGEQRHEE